MASKSQVLALEASTERCSVAIMSGGERDIKTCDTPKSHARVILPMVHDLLTAKRISLRDLDAILVSRGPGSFTGIRICISIAQGLAYGAHIPLMGVSSLQILASGLASRAPATDARQPLDGAKGPGQHPALAAMATVATATTAAASA